MSRPSDILRSMADRIDKLEESEFAGCVVVIPPESAAGVTLDNKAIEELRIDPRPDPAFFWSAAKARMDVAASAFAESMRASEQRGYR